MGGGNKAEQQQTQIAQQQEQTAQKQNEIGQEYIDFSKQRMAQGDALQKPLIDFYKGITSAPGNYTNTISAASPLLGNIATQTQQARANIMNTTPSGAGRDYALANLETQRGQQNAQTLNATYQNALQTLGQLGASQQGLSLQQTGAGLSAYSGGQAGLSGAANTNSSVMQAEAQRKASTMGIFGSLIGAAGTAAGGGVFGKL